MKRRFTLIELLVVIAIIGILASLLLPAMSRARYRAMLATDQSNQRQVYVGMATWAHDHNGVWLRPIFDVPWASYQAKRYAGRVVDAPIHTGLLYAHDYIPTFHVFYCPIANQGSIPGTRVQDYIDSTDYSWSTYSGTGYAGNKVRTGYMVNALLYTSMGSSGYEADTGAYDFGDHGPFIYDWLYDFKRTFHGPDWTMTMTDGSCGIYSSTDLFVRLAGGWSGLADNMGRHAQGLNYLLGK